MIYYDAALRMYIVAIRVTPVPMCLSSCVPVSRLFLTRDFCWPITENMPSV